MKVNLTISSIGSLLFAFLALPAAAQDLSLGMSDDSLSQSFDESVLEAWRVDSGAAIVVHPYENVVTTVAIAEATGQPLWDVVALSGVDESRLCFGGHLADLSQSLSESLPHLTADLSCGVPYVSYGRAIVYRADAFEVPKASWQFFDIDSFPGPRALPTSARGTFELALLADGVEVDEVYDVLSTDEGIDRVFQLLGSIREEIIWTSSGADAIQLLTDGEIAMALAWSSRINAGAEHGYEFDVINDFMLVEHDYLAILKDSEQYGEAVSLLEFAAGPEGLQTLYDQQGHRYSVPLENVSVGQGNQAPALICQKGACPCEAGGCEDDCCEDGSGHFEVDNLFWVNNEEALDRRLERWIFE
jgi:putative spermidine/putrescine transport system substrate-binding protein